jgi:hypothetical protein
MLPAKKRKAAGPRGVADHVSEEAKPNEMVVPNIKSMPSMDPSEIVFWLGSPSIPISDKISACLSLLIAGSGRPGEGAHPGRVSRAVLQFASGALVRSADAVAKKKSEGAITSTEHCYALDMKLWNLVEWALGEPADDVAAVVSGSLGHVLRAVQLVCEEDLAHDVGKELLPVCQRIMYSLRTTHQASFSPK